MINTISDLITEYYNYLKTQGDKFNYLTQPVIIGDMYEGFSNRILEKSIFKGLNLQIRNGFIKNSEGKLSKQIDGMIVVGDGERIPETEHYIYTSNSVIAMCETKKTLFSKEISDAYSNILDFKYTFEPTNQNCKNTLIKKSYQYLTNQILKVPIEQNSIENQYLYSMIVMMYSYPLRLILGYYGFSSEEHFRKAFVDYLDSNRGHKGYGVTSLPDLMICNQYSILKMNFQPFQPKMSNGFFPLLVSGIRNPMYYLVSMIWSKLQIQFNLPDEIWEDDNDSIDSFKPFLNAKFHSEPAGWEYQIERLDKSIDYNNLPSVVDYSPYYLDSDTFEFLVNAGVEDIKISSYSFLGSKLDHIINKLRESNYFEITDDTITAITMDLRIAMLDENKYVMGEDSDGVFSRWVDKQIKKSDT